MAGIEAGQLKKGMAVILEDKPHLIVELDFVKPGKGQALYKCRLRNLVTGIQYERTYRSGERFDVADVTETELQFLYSDGEYFHFMHNETYEQHPIRAEIVGDQSRFLRESLVVRAMLYNGHPISIELPNFVVMDVTVSEEWVKGDTASGATKPVGIESGYVLQVPLFIKQGEKIRIDTRTGAYVERVNK